MKALALIALLYAVTLLTGCASIAEELWIRKYRAMGGYSQPSTRVKYIEHPRP